MVGNASEEGLLGQVDNPSHGDPLRVVSLASFVAGGMAFFTTRWLFPMLTVWGGIVIGLAACLLVAWVLARWMRNRSFERAAREMAERRAAQQAETEVRIKTMRARSARES